jgi:serine/threonine protein kinase
MNSVPASSERPEAPLFSDGLGDRVVAVDAASGDLLQILKLRPQLLAVPSFEFALRERAARLANFRHAYYARVRRVDRHPGGLAIVSDHVEGTRLSEILRVAAERRLHLDLSAALCLIRQLVPSVSLLHENARDVAHGLIGPERLIVTPHARVVIAEHVLGSAVEQLQFNRERLWQELRVSLPSTAGAPRFDHRADVTAIGLVALALILGRPLRADEYPHRVSGLLNDARAKSAMGEEQPLPSALRGWLVRALQLDSRHGFSSATEAQAALEDVLTDDTGVVAAPVALETFLSRYIAALLEPVPTPVTTPPPVFTSQPAAPVVPVTPVPEKLSPIEPPASEYQVSFAPISPSGPPPQTISTPPPSPRPYVDVEIPAPRYQAPAMPVAPPPRVDPLPPPVPREAPASFAPVAPPPAPVAPPPAAPMTPSASASGGGTNPPLPDIETLLRADLALPQTRQDDFFAPQPPPPAKEQKISKPKTKGRVPKWARIAAIVVAVAAVAGGAGIASRSFRKPPPPVTGTLAVQTNPPGVSVFVDGESKGNTPARLTLNVGSHILELRGRGVPRVVPITVAAGAEVSQYLELPETPSTGSLLIQSDPAGAKVTVDGVAHGAAPVSVADLAPGDHEVVLQAEGGTPVKQHVVIQAGVTASVLAPVATASAGPVSGWLTVKSSVSIDIKEGGRLLGSTDTDKIMMTAGRHDLELVNETLGYRSLRTVQVPPGKVAAIGIEMPMGAINVNASPWAEVFIDGKRVGETPIGNLAVSIGPHEVLFRHPQLGEKRQAVSVTLNAPVRLSVDMK